MGQLVHRAFEGEHVRRLGRGAHEARRVPVGVHEVHGRRDVGAGVHPRRRPGAGEREGGRSRRHLPPFVREGHELSVPGRAQLDVVLRLRPVGGDGEALVAGCRQRHGAAETPRGDGDPCRVRQGHRLAAEGPADVSRDRADILRVQAELLRQRRLQPVLEL